MPTASHHVGLTLYEDDMTKIATHRKPTLLTSYIYSYLSDLQRWLSEWRIAVYVPKTSTMIFARAGRRALFTPDQ
jgi:hypothetical protein